MIYDIHSPQHKNSSISQTEEVCTTYSLNNDYILDNVVDIMRTQTQEFVFK